MTRGAPAPKFPNGTQVAADINITEVENSWLTVAGQRIYKLKGDHKLWEERLLHPLAQGAGRLATPQDPREPGEEG